MRNLEDRARAAYFRRFGADADIPSVSVDEAAGVVKLYNVNGGLGAYRITPDPTLRWDEDLAKRMRRERERLCHKKGGAGSRDHEPTRNRRSPVPGSIGLIDWCFSDGVRGAT
jgi:hypothetical protein